MSPADDRREEAAGQPEAAGLPEPAALAWQLASRKGWVDVDRAVLTCSARFPTSTSSRARSLSSRGPECSQLAARMG